MNETHFKDAFAIRSTKGRSRGSRRHQQAEEEEEENYDAVTTEVTANDDDDFLGLSAEAPKPHVRKHVDSAFKDFDTSPQQITKKPAQEEAGSFWDDNAGDVDDWEEQEPNGTKLPKKKEGIDQFLDDIGSMLNIHISNSVHEGVKSEREGVG